MNLLFFSVLCTLVAFFQLPSSLPQILLNAPQSNAPGLLEFVALSFPLQSSLLEQTMELSLGSYSSLPSSHLFFVTVSPVHRLLHSNTYYEPFPNDAQMSFAAMNALSVFLCSVNVQFSDKCPSLAQYPHTGCSGLVLFLVSILLAISTHCFFLLFSFILSHYGLDSFSWYSNLPWCSHFVERDHEALLFFLNSFIHVAFLISLLA